MHFVKIVIYLKINCIAVEKHPRRKFLQTATCQHHVLSSNNRFNPNVDSTINIFIPNMAINILYVCLSAILGQTFVDKQSSCVTILILCFSWLCFGSLQIFCSFLLGWKENKTTKSGTKKHLFVSKTDTY